MTAGSDMLRYIERLPMMLGTKQVCDCLGISRALLHRAMDTGRMRRPIKMGSTNRWAREYIRFLMENGLEPFGTYPIKKRT